MIQKIIAVYFLAWSLIGAANQLLCDEQLEAQRALLEQDIKRHFSDQRNAARGNTALLAAIDLEAEKFNAYYIELQCDQFAQIKKAYKDLFMHYQIDGVSLNEEIFLKGTFDEREKQIEVYLTTMNEAVNVFFESSSQDEKNESHFYAALQEQYAKIYKHSQATLLGYCIKTAQEKKIKSSEGGLLSTSAYRLNGLSEHTLNKRILTGVFSGFGLVALGVAGLWVKYKQNHSTFYRSKQLTFKEYCIKQAKESWWVKATLLAAFAAVAIGIAPNA